MDVLSNISPDAELDWLRQYATQKRVCDSENGVLRNILKRAKGEGVNVKALTATHRATKLDPDEVVADLAAQIRMMALRHIPVTRESLFGDWTPPVTQKSRMADDLWDAEDSGYQAGRYGTGLDECPYDAGSVLQVEWTRWWHKGQEAIARELGPDDKQASTARRGPRQQRIPGTEPRQHPPETGNGEAPRKRRGRPPGPRTKTATAEVTPAVN